MIDDLTIINARAHNLKVDKLVLPKGRLIVFTGPSGCGKSSLAFDTIFVESQRRYIESLSTYVRQFMHIYDKSDVESITGLSPSIAINQKSMFKTPRSTVATVTEIYDYLRVLFASVGVRYSEETGAPVEIYNRTQVIDSIYTQCIGKKIAVLSPYIADRYGKFDFAYIVKMGFSRVKVNGNICDIDDIKATDGIKSVEVVVDRIVIDEDSRPRVSNSVETALRINPNMVNVDMVDDKESMSFPIGGIVEKLEPRLFSFNNPIGACSACDGLGKRECFDPLLIISNPSWNIIEIVESISADNSKLMSFFKQQYSPILTKVGIKVNVPWKTLTPEIQKFVLFGDSEHCFPGLINFVQQIAEVHQSLKRYVRPMKCQVCNGARLNQRALHIKLLNSNISQVTSLSVLDVKSWLSRLKGGLTSTQWLIAEKIVAELERRIKYLENVGLDYITLDRETSTLSGGECQRIKLASQIGSGLTNIIYILDEPSIGLHAFDNKKMIDSIIGLRELGNTVILVEHDEDTIKAADYIVDMGPLAGIHGGKILAEGNLEAIMDNPSSVTGKCLKNINYIPVSKNRRVDTGKQITMHITNINNITDAKVIFPLQQLICITGVSGSGKSTLIMDVLAPTIDAMLTDRKIDAHVVNSINGVENIDKIIEIDQHPIGKTPRSNSATYTGVFDHIRQLLASTNEAKARGYKASRFSFNVRGGRCEDCEGDGEKKIEMHFMSDVHITCETCRGQRYNQDTLSIYYKGKNIYDILNMPIEEAVVFFSNMPLIKEKLDALMAVGLGYLTLGQSSNTLSGGESQRIKLARELSKKATGRTLYILDEPTTGLHTCDIQNLLDILNMLVDKGNTVIVVEHNLHIIKCADYIIDMGPQGGKKGGQVVASGTPEEIVQCSQSLTGRCLAEYL